MVWFGVSEGGVSLRCHCVWRLFFVSYTQREKKKYTGLLGAGYFKTGFFFLVCG